MRSSCGPPGGVFQGGFAKELLAKRTASRPKSKETFSNGSPDSREVVGCGQGATAHLRRLEAKGHLRGRKKGRATFDNVSVRADRVIRETVHDYVKRLFDGDPLPLMEHLISDSGLTPEESDRLRELLDRHEEQRHERGK